MVPDEYGSFGSLTVEENLRLFGADGDLSPALDVFPALEALHDRVVRTLSGGEQQMVALSRALLRPGRAVLLDEASRGLAPAVVERLYTALRALVTPHRCVVVVEQYVREALDVADLVYVLRRGEVVFAGEPAELRDDTDVARAIG
jgi:branched-chain amino acid transport system ATP-binding protein